MLCRLLHRFGYPRLTTIHGTQLPLYCLSENGYGNLSHLWGIDGRDIVMTLLHQESTTGEMVASPKSGQNLENPKKSDPKVVRQGFDQMLVPCGT